MATITSRSKRGQPSSKSPAQAGAAKTTSLSPSRSQYVNQYRTMRLGNPRLRIHCKLRMMSPLQIGKMEKLANELLGKKLADPMNPWAK